MDLVKIKAEAGTPHERDATAALQQLAKGVGTSLEWMPETVLTLQDRHQGMLLAFTQACTVTIPAGLRPDFSCGWMQAGTGALTFVASGITLRSFGSQTTSGGQWAIGGVAGIAPGEFVAYGQMA